MNVLVMDITPLSLSVLAIGLTAGGLVGKFKLYPVASLLALIFVPLAFVSPLSALTLPSWIAGLFFGGFAVGNFLSNLNHEAKTTIYMLIQQLQMIKAELDYLKVKEEK